MKEYHKINTIFKRDLNDKRKKIIEGEWSIPEFEYLQNNTWIFTEKVDGTNIRVMMDDIGKITFGGKTDNAQIPTKLLSRLQDIFEPIKNNLRDIFTKNVCLYGEGYGDKIQKRGGNYSLNQDFVLFDIKAGGHWLSRGEVEYIGTMLSIDVVPKVGTGSLHDAINIVRAGIQSRWGNFQAEGVVARPEVELKTKYGQRVITKIKCKDFLETIQ